uniref:IPPc domain-containing protein n=1 Tax=Steinernema glaseri TaxID=37863 RepID=A0A1I7ZW51_9BILA
MTFYDSSTNGYIPGKDLHVDSVLSEWEPRFCEFIDVRILVTTFNVNGKSPPSSPGALQPWFARKDAAPDFVVVGLQEMDLALGTYVKDSNTKQVEWLSAICKSLRGYTEVHSIKLVGIFLVVYQRIDGATPCGEIMSNYVPTGFLKFGNKGGVAIRMKINDTTICFINSHLAAGNELERRNQDYREISQLTFSDSSSIYEHDLIIWLGDLNYRLSTPPNITNETIRLKCSTGNFKSLLQFDQLLQQQLYRTTFHDFQEPEINFKPTYKYDTGTNNWDSSEKRRAPAWCDRILWRVMSEGTHVVASDYESIECITLSDHKPVRSLLHVTTKRIDAEKRRKLLDEANREADRRINNMRPKVRLSHTQLDFGDVWYMEPKVKMLTVENVGACPVHFKFVARPGNDDISPNWLSVTPPSGTVMKGGAVHLSLQVLIDQRIAWELGRPGHSGRLADILVVRLRDGGDSFVEVFANYKKSCFGVSFVELMNAPAPKSQEEELLIDLRDPSDAKQATTTSKVPLPLWKIVECLRANGLENIQMNDPPPDSGFVAIRNALDRGAPEQLMLMTGAGEVDLITVYTALLRLIDSFPDPIIPRDVASLCLQQVESPSFCSACVQRFSEDNRIVFDYLIDFLADLLPRHRSSQGLRRPALQSGLLCLSDQKRTKVLHRAVPQNTEWHPTNALYFVLSDELLNRVL